VFCSREARLITFYSESKFRDTQHQVFSDCRSLTSLLPASVSAVDGPFIVGSSAREIAVDEANANFLISRNLLVGRQYETW
jgi:hypothetical protein